MASNELKARTHQLLITLELTILSLSKNEVFDTVTKNTKPGGEREGTFTKYILREPLESIFGNLGLTIEGIDSKGRTTFERSFFGRKPSLDVVVRDLELVGEVKYCSLDLQNLARAIGQPTMYIGASAAESHKFSYGMVIFCDTTSQESFKFSDVEKSFKRDLWEKNGIYFILL